MTPIQNQKQVNRHDLDKYRKSGNWVTEANFRTYARDAFEKQTVTYLRVRQCQGYFFREMCL